MPEIIKNSKLIDLYVEKYNIDIINFADLRENIELIHFEKNEYIYRLEESIDYFYFFVEGKAKVFTSVENGRDLLLRFYRPLMIIGDLEFANKKRRLATTNIMALSSVYCIGIPMNVLEEKYKNDIVVLKFINESLAEKLESLSVSSSINLLYPLENRLASYIVYLNLENNENEIVLDKLVDVADLLGSSYRHLLRVLKKFQSNKWIKKDKNVIVVLNEKALKELAGDLYK